MSAVGHGRAGAPEELLDVLRLDVGGRADLDAHQPCPPFRRPPRRRWRPRQHRGVTTGPTLVRPTPRRRGPRGTVLDVDRPHVVVGPEDVVDREDRRHHRVVLVVVLVHAVATRRHDVRGVVGDPVPQDRDVVLVVLVVDRIRLGHPHDVAGLDLARVGEDRVLQLALALLDEVLVGLRPHLVALVHEELEAEARAALLDEVRRPGPEVLDATDLHRGIVDVDPVVGERELQRHDERDGHEVPVREALGGGSDVVGHRRIHGADQRTERHRRDDVRARGTCAPRRRRWPRLRRPRRRGGGCARPWRRR